MKKIPFAFFGSSRFSVIVLDELESADFIPALVVTTPDKPKGRKLALAPTPVKEWAQKRKIPVYDPAKLDGEFAEKLRAAVSEEKMLFFAVASYGKLIPEAIFALPPKKTLNLHPSLLPRYRGASPLQSAMLDDAKETGVTIIRMDGEMDHGPIVAQERITVNEWPIYEEFEETMARKSGRLLAKVIPEWLADELKEREQDHTQATFTKKMTKEDGLIDFCGDAYSNFRKIQAFHEWPQAYFFQGHLGKKIRVKITQASFGNSALTIEKVIPEGSREMPYRDFLKGYAKRNE